jgi:hypothetical protein
VSDGEFTDGGSEVFRHEARRRELELSAGDEALIDGVDEHLARHFGDVSGRTVLHEVISDLVHVDVHVVPPTGERSWHTLVTSGMAERPMRVPEGLEDHRYAELVLALPPDWPLDEAGSVHGGVEADESDWPIGMLKLLARLPHEFETFLVPGHTVPNGDPPERYVPDTGLCCAWITDPVLAPPGFQRLELADGRVVRFYAVVPIHEDEMHLKLDRGHDALAALMAEHEVTELLDPRRPSVVPRRRGLFRR